MSEWISVEDRWPDLDIPVLVVHAGDPDFLITAVRTVIDESWYWSQLAWGNFREDCNYECDDEYDYSHWMSLPSPPTTRNEDE